MLSIFIIILIITYITLTVPEDLPHICTEEDTVLNSKRILLAFNGLPLPSPI